MYNTRVLGHFAPIFYLNCKHVPLYTFKKKIFSNLIKKSFVDFENLLEIEFFSRIS